MQSDSSQQAMSDKKVAKEGSGAISEKDEGNNNQRAKETTKAPGPVIGMNDGKFEAAPTCHFRLVVK